MMPFLIDLIGWFGAATILSAYALLSAKKLGSQNPVYHWMNIIASICFIINSGYHGALPSVATNVIWALIGAWALLTIFRRKEHEQKSKD